MVGQRACSDSGRQILVPSAAHHGPRLQVGILAGLARKILAPLPDIVPCERRGTIMQLDLVPGGQAPGVLDSARHPLTAACTVLGPRLFTGSLPLTSGESAQVWPTTVKLGGRSDSCVRTSRRKCQGVSALVYLVISPVSLGRCQRRGSCVWVNWAPIDPGAPIGATRAGNRSNTSRAARDGALAVVRQASCSAPRILCATPLVSPNSAPSVPTSIALSSRTGGLLPLLSPRALSAH